MHLILGAVDINAVISGSIYLFIYLAILVHSLQHIRFTAGADETSNTGLLIISPDIAF